VGGCPKKEIQNPHQINEVEKDNSLRGMNMKENKSVSPINTWINISPLICGIDYWLLTGIVVVKRCGKLSSLAMPYSGKMPDM
jgi:hypothetical protein